VPKLAAQEWSFGDHAFPHSLRARCCHCSRR
jgi:hypothetical protein